MNQPSITLLVAQEAADLLGIQTNELDKLSQTAHLTRIERSIGDGQTLIFYAREEIEEGLENPNFLTVIGELCPHTLTKSHIYQVGIQPDITLIEAPNAASAAIYYGMYIANTNNPFAAHIYTKDGLPWHGEHYWLSWSLDQADVALLLRHLKSKIAQCRLLDSGDT